MIPGSPCVRYKTADGRISFGRKGNKNTFAYHVMAMFKYGPKAMTHVTADKTGHNALTTSHICGLSTCCNQDHIILEPKYAQEGRDHCHYCLLQALHRFDQHGAVALGCLKINKEPMNKTEYTTHLISLVCGHEPKCLTIPTKRQADLAFDTVTRRTKIEPLFLTDEEWVDAKKVKWTTACEYANSTAGKSPLACNISTLNTLEAQYSYLHGFHKLGTSDFMFE
jgi:hypothetical protein